MHASLITAMVDTGLEFRQCFGCKNWHASYVFAARSKAWTVFARWNTGIVGSNPTRGVNVCVRLFCVCVVLCVGSGLATGWFPVHGDLSTVYRIKKLKKRPRANGLYSHREREREREIVCIWFSNCGMPNAIYASWEWNVVLSRRVSRLWRPLRSVKLLW
jgi:hypothetical protein